MYAYKALINGQNYATTLLYKTVEEALKDALCHISMSRINTEYDFLGKPMEVRKSDTEPRYVAGKYAVKAFYGHYDEIDCGVDGYYDEKFTIHIIQYTIID